MHRGATGPHQKIVGGAAKVQGFVAAVDQHRGRGKAVQNQLLRNAGHLAQGRGAAGGGQLKARPVVAQARGQGQRVGPGAALALKNAPFFGNRVEQVVPHAVGLGTAEQQVAVFAQGKVKNIEHPLLQVGLQVDQHIAATDQVHPTKRRVREHVLRAKHHHRAQRFAHREMLAVRALDEVALEPAGRHAGGNANRVAAAAAHLQRVVVGVGGKYLHSAGFAGAAQAVQHHHGHGVSLFAGGAARHPDANGLVSRLGRHQGGDDFRLQGSPRLGVAEKLGHANEQVPKQRVHFFGLFFEQRHISTLRHDAAQAHAPLDAAQQRGALVA